MRKNTINMIKALTNGYNAKASRDTVRDGIWQQHGNTIAYYEGGDLHLTLAGWNSPTTRERLNGLLNECGLTGIGFAQRNFEAVLVVNGRKVANIDEYDTYTVDQLRAVYEAHKEA